MSESEKRLRDAEMMRRVLEARGFEPSVERNPAILSMYRDFGDIGLLSAWCSLPDHWKDSDGANLHIDQGGEDAIGILCTDNEAELCEAVDLTISYLESINRLRGK